MPLKMKNFDDIVAKEETTVNQLFLCYHECVLSYKRRISGLESSANGFDSDRSKLLTFCEELTNSQTNPVFYESAVQVF